MSEVKHTPVPWFALHDEVCWRPSRGTVSTVADCRMYLPDDASNAAFIVKAANSHEKLVAALQNIMNGITTGAIKSDYDETMDRAVTQAHDALALARGQS
jgi:hypothetical protein